MNKRMILASVLILTIVVAVAIAQGGKGIREILLGFEEVPAVSTTAHGEFKATINKDETAIAYELSYAEMEGNVLQAHIHLGQRGVNGGISVWLCGNPNANPPVNPPPGTQACPPSPATITGVITPSDIVGPAAQGIDPNANDAAEFAELIRAIRAGVTYVNVHSNKFPGGEIRSQIDHGHGNEHGTQK
jgi:hypothetical protein